MDKSTRGGYRPGAGRPRTRYIVSVEAVERIKLFASEASERAKKVYAEYETSKDDNLLAEYYRNLSIATAYQESLRLIESEN